MHAHHINDMVRKLGPVLKDRRKARHILDRYWSDKIALVWDTEDVFRAANERELALTKAEAVTVLQDLHHHHNAQEGLRWADVTAYIEEHVLGRKMTKTEVDRFVKRDILTIQK